ncbi:hypothetical protein EAI_13710 [Harpegnathos saltator]|uniref:MADF domain-containing protein n=1 Tax=Harpegnathos saltator TaxID=610380 RepID=E2B8T4_HARSA|nr:hypothetical protein EAI_13710 [Harpegnathos saltator]
MKRTYKTIKDHNSKSGNNNRTWKYYEVMESLLREKTYIDLLLTISSTGSVTYKSGKLKSADSCSNDSSSESSGPVSRKRRVSNTLEAILANRQIAEEQKNKRHKTGWKCHKKY